jgi:hypothetical protein
MMRVNNTTALAVRAGFVRPWSGLPFILVRVQFTLRKVHFKFRKIFAWGYELIRIFSFYGRKRW